MLTSRASYQEWKRKSKGTRKRRLKSHNYIQCLRRRESSANLRNRAREGPIILAGPCFKIHTIVISTIIRSLGNSFLVMSILLPPFGGVLFYVCLTLLSIVEMWRRVKFRGGNSPRAKWFATIRFHLDASIQGYYRHDSRTIELTKSSCVLSRAMNNRSPYIHIHVCVYMQNPMMPGFCHRCVFQCQRFEKLEDIHIISIHTRIERRHMRDERKKHERMKR